jgi:ABC-type lipoprotein release transport system permease subunit
MMFISLAWRNIWRNKKRTLIVAASVFFSVFLAIMMRSSQLGSYSYMIYSSAKLFTGFLQVQGKGYWDNRSLNKSIIIDKQTLRKIASLTQVTSAAPRLESFSLISHGLTTKVTSVIGIDPSLETKMTDLKSRIIKGHYLNADSDGALLGSGLADMLKVSVKDSIVLYGQGYHGQIAAAIVPVAGIVKLPFGQMNNGLIFLPLNRAQEIFSAEKRITSLPIMIDDIRHIEQVEAEIRNIIGNQFVILHWDEMMPELKQNIQTDNAGGLIMLTILYIVIGFGILGTVMMMISERSKEFGILISIGMRKSKLITITAIESLIISMLGAAAGIIFSYPAVLYMYHHPIHFFGEGDKLFDSLGIEPIFFFSKDISILFSQAEVILIIASLTAIYSIIHIYRLDPIKAMRG